VTVVRQPNRGVAAARKAGLDARADDASAVSLLDSYDHRKELSLAKHGHALKNATLSRMEIDEGYRMRMGC
jgi:hypothetical protein